MIRIEEISYQIDRMVYRPDGLSFADGHFTYHTSVFALLPSAYERSVPESARSTSLDSSSPNPRGFGMGF
jgi:hypothetical protein